MDGDGGLISAAGWAVRSLDALPAVPSAIRDFIAIALDDSALFVERRKMADPHVMTWLSRCEAAGIRLTPKPAEMDELVELRAQEAPRARLGEEDLQNRSAAVALIRGAAEIRASDVHILMPGNRCEIQVRVDGDLRVFDQLSFEQGEALARALYQSIATSRDASYNPFETQNAQISGAELSGTGLTSVRIIRAPCFPVTQGGGVMVLRLQYATTDAARPNLGRSDPRKRPALRSPRQPAGTARFQAMGFSPAQERALRTLAAAPNGVVIFSGPTGSGKTSTIYECMQLLGREHPTRRIISIEDPVEYPMTWAVQLEVANAITEAETGAAFMKWVRAALRMDPDIIMCGEIRGAEVAVATIQAAVTGHLVYTTLHVTDPFLAVDRLEMMDRERLNRRVFCDSTIIRGLVAQRLVPKLCVHCARPLSTAGDTIAPEIIEALATYGDLSEIRVCGPGCDHCGGVGKAGRLAVAEIVVTTPDLMQDMVKHGTEIARSNHRRRRDADGSLLGNAVGHALAGLIDPRDISRYVDILVPRENGSP